MRKRSGRAQERMADMTAILQESISGVRVVKAFGMEEFERSALRPGEPGVLRRLRAPAPGLGGRAAAHRARDRAGGRGHALVRRAADLRAPRPLAAGLHALRGRAAHHALADQEPGGGEREHPAGRGRGPADLLDARHRARDRGPSRGRAAAGARGPDPLRARLVRLRARPAGARGGLLRAAPGRGRGAGGVERRGQEHGDGPAGALLRAHRRAASRWTAWTCGTARWRRCGPSSAS